MKLRERLPEIIHLSGIDTKKRTQLRVASSRKTFKILSSTIYKYKIRAIIRELSTNAVDGHIEAGSMDYFDVHIPTVLEPFFSVRDYGVGMTDHMIMNVYTTYFESTKNESNDTIGSLGLGSKSPICYTEMFTVESIVDGVKRGYSIYLDDGEPFCQPMYEVETDEPNGVIVTVPVQVADIQEWETEALRVYESFTTIRPNFVGATKLNVNYQPTEPNYHGIIRHQSTYTGMFARMGNIIYPIDGNMYSDKLFSCYLDNDAAYIVDFPIGDLDFMPSREELSLDRITKDTVMKRLDKINSGFYDRLYSLWAKLKTTRDKLSWYQHLPTLVQFYINEDRNTEFRINGEKLGDLESSLIKADNYKNFDVSGYWANGSDYKLCMYTRVGSGSRYSPYRSENLSRQNILRLMNTLDQKELVVIDCDVAKIRPYLIGYSIMHKDGDRVSFVSKHDPLLPSIIERGHFDESEIIYLKASEMEEEKAAYIEVSEKRKRERKEKSDSEGRPKSPNVYEYTLVDGEPRKLSLCMTKKEFLEMPPAYAANIFGIDQISPLDGSDMVFNLDNVFMSESKIASFMKINNLSKIILVRTSKWKDIKDSKMMCLFNLCVNNYNKAGKIKESNFPNNIASKYRFEVSFLSDHMGVRLDRLFKTNYDTDLYSYMEFMSPLAIRRSVKEHTEVSQSIRDAHTQFKKNKKSVNKKVDDAYEKFAALNPLMDAIIKITDNYRTSVVKKIHTDKKVVEDFVKKIRWK